MTGKEMVKDGVHTIAEAAEVIKLSRTTIYALMESGELPYTKIGKRRLIPRRALSELMERGLVIRDTAVS
jgi:excisionase family DNA binding protein